MVMSTPVKSDRLKKRFEKWDVDGNGRIELRDSPSDAIGSIANFFGALGGFPHDVWLHTMGLIFSGAFDRFPKLRLVIGHMGECLRGLRGVAIAVLARISDLGGAQPLPQARQPASRSAQGRRDQPPPLGNDAAQPADVALVGDA